MPTLPARPYPDFEDPAMLRQQMRALIRAAKGHALLAGNDFVTPDDVKEVAPPVLRHRVALTADLEIEGAGVDDTLAQLLGRVDAPRA